MATASELDINTSATADQMAEEMFGDGMTIVNATYSGDNLSSGIYTNGDRVTDGVTPSDTGVILSTGHASDFTNATGGTDTNQAAGTTTDTSGINNDTDFNALAGTNTYDSSFMSVDFIPTGDTLTLDFVLSSEEYPEWIDTAYNDMVGLWVNGVQATVSVGNGDVSIGNINGDDTPNLFVDNTGDQYNTEMDGFTITLSFSVPVNVGVVNTLKIGVADVGDSTYDSNLLIAGDSVQSAIVAGDDSFESGLNHTKTLDVLDNDSTDDPSGELTITHINGIEVVVGDTVVLNTGQSITLNADGTLTFEADGDTESAYFNYSVVDDSGNTDTALVSFDQQPCFVKGTEIMTDKGSIKIEDLRSGDLVLTADNGLQPIRWIGGTEVDGTGIHAPVHLKKGAFGLQNDLKVSQQHRILITDVWAELLFGEPEVLIKAKDLINDSTVRIDREEERVEYFHLLFETHQLITSNGAITESYHPGPQTMQGFDAATQAEVIALFPELDLFSGQGYGPSARITLKAFESKVLRKKSPQLMRVH